MKKAKYFKTLITYFSLYLQAVKEEPKDTNKDTDTKPKVQYSIIIKKSLTLYCYILLQRFYSIFTCLLYTSPSPRDKRQSRMPSSA